jgi:hypothetical protein
MKFVDWSLICVLCAIPAGCAGSLDPTEDYFSTPLNSTASHDAGTSKAWRDAGPPPAMPMQGSAQAGSPANMAMNTDDDAGAIMPAGRDDDDAGMPPALPACDFRGLVMNKCAGSSCHGGPNASTGLDLTSPSLASRVKGRKGTGACTDKLLVDPDNPQDSKLFLKVSSSTCGVKMPLGGSLTASEQTCFLSWIEGL